MDFVCGVCGPSANLWLTLLRPWVELARTSCWSFLGFTWTSSETRETRMGHWRTLRGPCTTLRGPCVGLGWSTRPVCIARALREACRDIVDFARTGGGTSIDIVMSWHRRCANRFSVAPAWTLRGPCVHLVWTLHWPYAPSADFGWTAHGPSVDLARALCGTCVGFRLALCCPFVGVTGTLHWPWEDPLTSGELCMDVKKASAGP